MKLRFLSMSDLNVADLEPIEQKMRFKKLKIYYF